MMDNFANFMKTIAKFSTGYYKTLVLDYVSNNAFDIMLQHIGLVKSNMESILTVFEEIRATSQNVAEHTFSIHQQMGSLIEGNKAIDQKLNRRVKEISETGSKASEMMSLFQNLSEKSKEIRGITGKIQTVSKKTNVLAINASIEASKAGVQGTGFSIIASEVRNLAVQTGDFAKEIDKTIGMFVDHVDRLSQYIQGFSAILSNFQGDIGEIKDIFVSNKDLADSVGQALHMISDSTREENLALTEGLTKLEKIYDGANTAAHVASSIKKAYQGLEKLLNR